MRPQPIRSPLLFKPASSNKKSRRSASNNSSAFEDSFDEELRQFKDGEDKTQEKSQKKAPINKQSTAIDNMNIMCSFNNENDEDSFTEFDGISDKFEMIHAISSKFEAIMGNSIKKPLSTFDHNSITPSPNLNFHTGSIPQMSQQYEAQKKQKMQFQEQQPKFRNNDHDLSFRGEDEKDEPMNDSFEMENGGGGNLLITPNQPYSQRKELNISQFMKAASKYITSHSPDGKKNDDKLDSLASLGFDIINQKIIKTVSNPPPMILQKGTSIEQYVFISTDNNRNSPSSAPSQYKNPSPPNATQNSEGLTTSQIRRQSAWKKAPEIKVKRKFKEDSFDMGDSFDMKESPALLSIDDTPPKPNMGKKKKASNVNTKTDNQVQDEEEEEEEEKKEVGKKYAMVKPMLAESDEWIPPSKNEEPEKKKTGYAMVKPLLAESDEYILPKESESDSFDGGSSKKKYAMVKPNLAESDEWIPPSKKEEPEKKKTGYAMVKPLLAESDEYIPSKESESDSFDGGSSKKKYAMVKPNLAESDEWIPPSTQEKQKFKGVAPKLASSDEFIPEKKQNTAPKKVAPKVVVKEDSFDMTDPFNILDNNSNIKRVEPKIIENSMFSVPSKNHPPIDMDDSFDFPSGNGYVVKEKPKVEVSVIQPGGVSMFLGRLNSITPPKKQLNSTNQINEENVLESLVALVDSEDEADIPIRRPNHNAQQRDSLILNSGVPLEDKEMRKLVTFDSHGGDDDSFGSEDFNLKSPKDTKINNDFLASPTINPKFRNRKNRKTVDKVKKVKKVKKTRDLITIKAQHIVQTWETAILDENQDRYSINPFTINFEKIQNSNSHYTNNNTNTITTPNNTNTIQSLGTSLHYQLDDEDEESQDHHKLPQNYPQKDRGSEKTFSNFQNTQNSSKLSGSEQELSRSKPSLSNSKMDSDKDKMAIHRLSKGKRLKKPNNDLEKSNAFLKAFGQKFESIIEENSSQGSSKQIDTTRHRDPIQSSNDRTTPRNSFDDFENIMMIGSDMELQGSNKEIDEKKENSTSQIPSLGSSKNNPHFGGSFNSPHSGSIKSNSGMERTHTLPVSNEQNPLNSNLSFGGASLHKDRKNVDQSSDFNPSVVSFGVSGFNSGNFSYFNQSNKGIDRSSTLRTQEIGKRRFSKDLFVSNSSNLFYKEWNSSKVETDICSSMKELLSMINIAEELTQSADTLMGMLNFNSENYKQNTMLHKKTQQGTRLLLEQSREYNVFVEKASHIFDGFNELFQLKGFYKLQYDSLVKGQPVVVSKEDKANWMSYQEISELFPQFTKILAMLGIKSKQMCSLAIKSPVWDVQNTVFFSSEVQAIQTAFSDLRLCLADILTVLEEDKLLKIASKGPSRRRSDASMVTFEDLIENIAKVVTNVSYWSSCVQRLEEERAKPIIRVSDQDNNLKEEVNTFKDLIDDEPLKENRVTNVLSLKKRLTLTLENLLKSIEETATFVEELKDRGELQTPVQTQLGYTGERKGELKSSFYEAKKAMINIMYKVETRLTLRIHPEVGILVNHILDLLEPIQDKKFFKIFREKVLPLASKLKEIVQMVNKKDFAEAQVPSTSTTPSVSSRNLKLPTKATNVLTMAIQHCEQMNNQKNYEKLGLSRLVGDILSNEETDLKDALASIQPKDVYSKKKIIKNLRMLPLCLLPSDDENSSNDLMRKTKLLISRVRQPKPIPLPLLVEIKEFCRKQDNINDRKRERVANFQKDYERVDIHIEAISEAIDKVFCLHINSEMTCIMLATKLLLEISDKLKLSDAYYEGKKISESQSKDGRRHLIILNNTIIDTNQLIEVFIKEKLKDVAHREQRVLIRGKDQVSFKQIITISNELKRLLQNKKGDLPAKLRGIVDSLRLYKPAKESYLSKDNVSTQVNKLKLDGDINFLLEARNMLISMDKMISKHSMRIAKILDHIVQMSDLGGNIEINTSHLGSNQNDQLNQIGLSLFFPLGGGVPGGQLIDDGEEAEDQLESVSKMIGHIEGIERTDFWDHDNMYALKMVVSGGCQICDEEILTIDTYISTRQKNFKRLSLIAGEIQTDSLYISQSIVSSQRRFSGVQLAPPNQQPPTIIEEESSKNIYSHFGSQEKSIEEANSLLIRIKSRPGSEAESDLSEDNNSSEEENWDRITAFYSMGDQDDDFPNFPIPIIRNPVEPGQVNSLVPERPADTYVMVNRLQNEVPSFIKGSVYRRLGRAYKGKKLASDDMVAPPLDEYESEEVNSGFKFIPTKKWFNKSRLYQKIPIRTPKAKEMFIENSLAQKVDFYTNLPNKIGNLDFSKMKQYFAEETGQMRLFSLEKHRGVRKYAIFKIKDDTDKRYAIVELGEKSNNSPIIKYLRGELSSPPCLQLYIKSEYDNEGLDVLEKLEVSLISEADPLRSKLYFDPKRTITHRRMIDLLSFTNNPANMYFYSEIGVEISKVRVLKHQKIAPLMEDYDSNKYSEYKAVDRLHFMSPFQEHSFDCLIDESNLKVAPFEGRIPYLRTVSLSIPRVLRAVAKLLVKISKQEGSLKESLKGLKVKIRQPESTLNTIKGFLFMVTAQKAKQHRSATDSPQTTTNLIQSELLSNSRVLGIRVRQVQKAISNLVDKARSHKMAVSKVDNEVEWQDEEEVDSEEDIKKVLSHEEAFETMMEADCELQEKVEAFYSLIAALSESTSILDTAKTCYYQLIKVFDSHQSEVFKDDEFKERVSSLLKNSTRPNPSLKHLSWKKLYNIYRKPVFLKHFIPEKLFDPLNSEAAFTIVMSSLCPYPNRIKKIFGKEPNNIRRGNPFLALIFKSGFVSPTLVTDQVPIREDEDGDRPVFQPFPNHLMVKKEQNPGQKRIIKEVDVWPQVLAKALAKNVMSYERFMELNVDQLLRMVTGMPCSIYTPERTPFRLLQRGFQKKYIMIAEAKPSFQDQVMERANVNCQTSKINHFIINHVFNTESIPGCQESMSWVELMHPHCKNTFDQGWSTAEELIISTDWRHHRNYRKKREQGTFWIKFATFQRMFSKLHVCSYDENFYRTARSFAIKGSGLQAYRISSDIRTKVRLEAFLEDVINFDRQERQPTIRIFILKNKNKTRKFELVKASNSHGKQSALSDIEVGNPAKDYQYFVVIDAENQDLKDVRNYNLTLRCNSPSLELQSVDSGVTSKVLQESLMRLVIAKGQRQSLMRSEEGGSLDRWVYSSSALGLCLMGYWNNTLSVYEIIEVLKIKGQYQCSKKISDEGRMHLSLSQDTRKLVSFRFKQKDSLPFQMDLIETCLAKRISKDMNKNNQEDFKNQMRDEEYEQAISFLLI